MAWTADIWSQNDSKFFGFPFVTDSGIAGEFNGTNSIWKMESGKFFGFPYIKVAGIAGESSPEPSGNTEIYYNDFKVYAIYYNDYPVTKLYYNDILVYESS